MRLDLHVHTTASADGRIDPRRVAAVARSRGMDGIAVSDHNAISGYRIARSHARGLLIVPAIEVSAKGGHLIALGVDELLPAHRPPLEIVESVRDLGGLAVLVHPYRFVSGMGDRLADRFDLIEGWNGKCTYKNNRKASALAQRLGLPVTGGSDAHFPHDVGTGYVELDGDACSVDEVLTMLEKGRGTAKGVARRPLGVAGHTLRSALLFLRRGERV